MTSSFRVGRGVLPVEGSLVLDRVRFGLIYWSGLTLVVRLVWRSSDSCRIIGPTLVLQGDVQQCIDEICLILMLMSI